MRFVENLKRLMDQAGLDQKTLSLKAGLGATAVRDILTGRAKHPRHVTIAQLAKVLGVSVAELAGDNVEVPVPDEVTAPAPGTGDAASSAKRPVAGDIREAAVRGPAVPLPAIALMPRDMPVYGAAAAGDGEFELNTGEAIDWARRPPALEGVRDAFGVYVTEDSMWPRFESGELLIIHPRRPPVPGCDVIVELREETEGPRKAILKRFQRRTATKLVLEQFNPKRTLEIPLSKIVAVHRVLKWHEVLGV